jgi:hypothetical protein
MKESKPRIKKVQKEPPRAKKPGDPPQMTVPWGRAASEHRPGTFIKRYLAEHGQACAADVFTALKEEVIQINTRRVEIGDKPIKGCTYNSFAKYWHWFLILGLIERTGRREPAIYDFLQNRVFYRLTGKGQAEVGAWEDPLRAAHPEFR